MLAGIIAFALVIAVLGLGAAALLILRVAALTRAWDSNFRLLEMRVQSTSQTQLRAELDDLRGALDTIRASNRKELGAIWGRLGGKAVGAVIDGETGVRLPHDAELEAMLALQNAVPVKPQ